MNGKWILIFAAATAMALGSCAKRDNDELAHHHDHGHEHGHSHCHAPDGHEGDRAEPGDVIELSPAVAAMFGVSTEKAAERPFSAVVKAGGEVMASSEGSGVVTSPTSGIVTLSQGVDLGSKLGRGALVASVSAAGISGGDANRLAKIDLDAATAEWQRVEGLYADRLVTLSEYNAARTAYERAKAAYSAPAAAGKAISPMAGVVTSLNVRSGQYVEAGQPIAVVSASDRLIVRAEVPVKSYSQVASAQDARLVMPSGVEDILVSELDGRRVDMNSAAGSARGYVPVTFSVRNDGSLLAGQAVEMYILGPSERKSLAVPVSAVTEQQGSFFVFVRLDEDCYRKLPVTLGTSDGAYVEIKSGLVGGEDIVSSGVTAVKLAQSSGAVPEGHTHSH